MEKRETSHRTLSSGVMHQDTLPGSCLHNTPPSPLRDQLRSTEIIGRVGGKVKKKRRD